MKYMGKNTVKYTAILVLAIMAAGAANAQTSPYCNGMDKCKWSSDLNGFVGLPMRSNEDICSLPQTSVWPIGSEASPSLATMTCDFDSAAGAVDFYYIIDNDVVSCTLNGVPVSGFPYTHENCAKADPMTEGIHVTLNAQSGSNQLVCVVRDRGVMSYFNACVIPSETQPLPEFGSTAAVLAVLTIAPVAAFVLVRRKQ